MSTETRSNGNVRFLSAEDEEILGEVDPESITPEVRIHSMNPVHLGLIANADGSSQVTGICEDTVYIQLRVKEKQIVDARFQVRGCGFTIACGNAACTYVTGKRLAAALNLDGGTIDQILGGLPKGHRHCADLAAKAMQAAAKDVLANARDPWKRTYGANH